MIKPYYGREMYYANFKQHVLDKLADFKLGQVVEMEAADLSQYGLAEPSLDFWYKGGEGDLHLLFGDRTDGGNIYVKYADRPQVFVTEFNSVSALFGVNVLSLVEKFIALINIEDCDSIDIVHSTVPERNLRIEINHEQLPPEEGEEEGEKIINPTINGKAIEEDPFREVYRYLIALIADLEVEAEIPEDEPVFTITYNMLDGKKEFVAFHKYDDNFYTARREGVEFVFVTNKQSTEMFFNEVERLMGE
jgi:hypothetical protein